jgi:hypothetical protein
MFLPRRALGETTDEQIALRAPGLMGAPSSMGGAEPRAERRFK